MFEQIIIRPFLNVLEKYADNNAFCIDGRYYSYTEFANHISKIRKALRSANPGSKNVGLVANDDIETYAAIFAFWLEGYAYVPLHPQQPVERNLDVMSQAHIEVVFNSNDHILLPGIQTINFASFDFDRPLLQPKATPDIALAYILFTSGSTGKPKGVPIMRHNLATFIKSFMDVGFKIDQSDRCLQCFDLTFDVSVQSFLVPLLKGACVYTVPHDRIKYSYVYGLLEDHQLTVGAMAPSMIRYLRPYFEEINIPSMRYNILTAEASPVDLVTEWSNCIPNAEIFDFYGPTEATIYCTYYKFNRRGVVKHLNGMMSIGKPMQALKAIIIDQEGNILGNNERGQLCISGDQLTPGYWNNPQKTEEAFFEREVEDTVRRFYKTGDFCYIDTEGDIMYSGRMDSQVKIQGYRIELGEIEYHARECLHVQNAVAIPFENHAGNTEIALYVEGEFTDTDFLYGYLKSKIPSYMIPTRILCTEKFPLNLNGKIDRNVLKYNIEV